MTRPQTAKPASERALQVYDDLFGALEEIGIELTAGLPDDWVAPLIDRLEAAPRITNVRVAREPEIIGICSGAFFAGVPAAGVMGSTGFLTCISEMASLNLKYGIPLFLIVTLRGGIHDGQVFQEVQSRRVPAVARALDLPGMVIDRPEKIALLPKAYTASRLHKRPWIAWISKSLLLGEESEF